MAARPVRSSRYWSVIHPTAEVESGASVGANTRIWHHAHVRAGAVIGSDCNLGLNVYVDSGAVIGNQVKIQNRVSIYRGVTIEDGVFIGPHVTFTNDLYPRSVTSEGESIEEEGWTPVATLVKYAASIGAGTVILPGITIGRWAMIGAGSLVTRDVPDHGLALGSPARLAGYACRCGRRLQPDAGRWTCPHCHQTYDLPPLPEAGDD
ncbi:MAG: N-acetyltransferase [Dehalococcoidia bacterium]|nr:N-acetyltransferase [Dehalococcoidia bacterium]